MEWENEFASTILFFPTFFGLFFYMCYWIAFICEKKNLTEAYYQFVLSITFSNAPMLIMFAAYAAPCTLLEKYLGGLSLNFIMGALSNLLWFSSLPMYQCIAINRLITLKYRQWVPIIYTQNKIYFMITFCWIYGLCYFAVSLHPCCYFLYFVDQYSFKYDDEHRFGSRIFSFVDLSNSCLTAFVSIGCNAATFIHLRKKNRQIQSALDDASNSERQKTEQKLFVLFFVVILYLLLHDAIFILVPYMTDSKWGGLMTCVTYIVHLSLDGIINVCFNKVVRETLKKLIFK